MLAMPGPSRMPPRFTTWAPLLLSLPALLTLCRASCGPEGSTVNQDVAVTSYPANVSHYCERFQEFNRINPSGDVSMRNG